MNCMSVQQEKKNNYQQRSQAYQHSNTTSRVGLRSCLRGEIEDTECKIELFSFNFLVRLLRNRSSVPARGSRNSKEADPPWRENPDLKSKLFVPLGQIPTHGRFNPSVTQHRHCSAWKPYLSSTTPEETQTCATAGCVIA